MDRAKDKERDMQELSIKRLKWQGHGGADMTKQKPGAPETDLLIAVPGKMF